MQSEQPEPEYPCVYIERELTAYFTYFHTLRLDAIETTAGAHRFQPLDQTVPMTSDLWNWCLESIRAHDALFAHNHADPSRLSTPMGASSGLDTFSIHQKFAMLFALNYYDAPLLLDVLVRDMAGTLYQKSDSELDQLRSHDDDDGFTKTANTHHARIERVVEYGTANLTLASRIMACVPPGQTSRETTSRSCCTSCPDPATISDHAQGRFHFCTVACYDDFFHTPIRFMHS